jgi:hypothetical protein
MSELDPRLAAALQPRVTRLGYLGEFFKCLGHQPEALLSFMALTDALKEALPDRLTEIVALTVATATGNDYERHQHERLCEKLGFGRVWIAAIIALRPEEGAALSDLDRTVQRLAIASVASGGRGVGAELAAVTAAVGHRQAAAVLMLIGRYQMQALMINALGLAPPVPSIFVGPG